MDKRTMVAGLLAAAALACGEPARDVLGEMMRDAGSAMEGMGRAGRGTGVGMLADAGRALQDAGGALADAGESDAAVAQPSPAAEPTIIEGTCTALSGRRFTNGADASGSATYYAKVSTEGRNAYELVGAALVLCDWDVIGVAPLECPLNTVCDELGTFPWPAAGCEVRSSFEVREGAVWAPCGARTETSSAGRTATYGGKFASIKLVIPAR